MQNKHSSQHFVWLGSQIAKARGDGIPYSIAFRSGDAV
jgi:hypothetical protein